MGGAGAAARKLRDDGNTGGAGGTGVARRQAGDFGRQIAAHPGVVREPAAQEMGAYLGSNSSNFAHFQPPRKWAKLLLLLPRYAPLAPLPPD